ncbi:MAG: putative metal-binding motif-containing protein [Deltaproteobacteria bacterium]|nr:putative metal-binding motif-containing protein [Deltaproteobacteria bacterium]
MPVSSVMVPPAKPMRPSRSRGRLAIAASLACFFAACGDDDAPFMFVDTGVPPPPADAGPQDARQPLPDGATLCTRDRDCDDGIECTDDRCDTDRGYCLNEVDAEVCQDDSFCNGREICVPGRGCDRGPPESCNDDDVCTLDACDEENDTCLHRERDLDGDGDPDEHCMGGEDCDDLDPRISSTASELCDDGVDNNCNGDVDDEEAGGCASGPHDTCADPLDAGRGGFFVVSTVGTAVDYMATCGFGVMHDVVLELEVAEPSDVVVRVSSDVPTNLALQSECGSRTSELDCLATFDGEIRSRALDPGTYFVLVQTTDPTEVGVEIVVSEPTPPPPNLTCDGAIDVSDGGVFRGSFVDVESSTDHACGSFGGADLYYRFTLTETQDVSIRASTGTGDAVTLAVRRTCSDASSLVRCANASPSSMLLHQLPAGDYFLVVEGPTFRETDFTLTIEILPPTPAPMGDLCTNPIPLTIGETVMGTLLGFEDDVATSCGYHYRDVVYTFDLEERSDVRIEVGSSTGGYFFVETTQTCGMRPEIRCVSGGPSRTVLRALEPGTYFVVVESFTARAFDLTLTAGPPVMVTEVEGNDTCETAFDVPPTGGAFSGNTSTLANDYTWACGASGASNDAVFRLDLASSRRVVLTTEGSTYDTVLGIRREPCAGPGGEVVCRDDGGFMMADTLDQTLDPGTWFVVVDGFGSAMSGAYLLDVMLMDP